MQIDVHESVLKRNDSLAEANRARFGAHGLRVLNMLSSPGSGKTALLERTLCDLGEELRMAVIVGDLATENDALRLRRSGAKAVQITTGDVCHLEAQMVARAADQLDLGALDLLFIENVGNLVCPCSYDLGEDLRIVLLSVTEGEDKPLKYPSMFKSADVIVLTKTDIAEAVGFQWDAARDAISRVAPQAQVLAISSRSEEGMAAWYEVVRRICAPHLTEVQS